MTIIESNKVIKEKIHEIFKDQINEITGYFTIINDIGKELKTIEDVLKLEDSDQIIEILQMMYDSRVDKLNDEFDVKNVPKHLRLRRFEE